ncbi:hypothetical protein ABIB40_001681 [Pedobacter sp. UYP30]|uniref:hypothetical protein n=1 Tax=Pedobacter sp. UYP30 TaxID=1756400 RepID=UPI00339597F2
MLQKKPLSQQEIKNYLQADKAGKSMGMQIGIDVVSVAAFSLSVSMLIDPIALNKSINVFWGLCIVFLTGIGSFVGTAIACVKYALFRKIFPFIAIIIVIVSAFFEGGMSLITPLILYAVLGIVYLFKLEKHQEIKSELSQKEKTVFTGILASASQQQEQVNTGKAIYTRSFWKVLINDGEQEMSFNVSNEKMLGMYVSGRPISFKNLENKEVVTSFLDPNILLAIVPSDNTNQLNHPHEIRN